MSFWGPHFYFYFLKLEFVYPFHHEKLDTISQGVKMEYFAYLQYLWTNTPKHSYKMEITYASESTSNVKYTSKEVSYISLTQIQAWPNALE